MNWEESIEKSRKLISESDVILIGAGSGLSAAAGLSYTGNRFSDNFADYIKKYSLTDMYSSAFHPFPTPEEKWGYFSRHIKLNRYDAPVGKVYSDLLQIVEDKEYFVITTNVDAQFFKAGFEADSIFATQGDYGKFQCAKACHETLYANEDMITQMAQQQNDCRIPSELIPICPVCGEQLVSHLRIDGTFVENDDWQAASQRYLKFIRQAKDKNLLMLELGVGYNTPSIIRWPFEQLSGQYPNSSLIRVNKDHVQSSYPVSDKSIFLKADIAGFMNLIV